MEIISSILVPVIFASTAVEEKDEQTDYLLRRTYRHSQTGFLIAVKTIYPVHIFAL